jgi:hypothetical protein
MIVFLQARNRNRTDDLSLTTRALPAAAALRAKMKMVGQGLEPHPFGLQPSALPVELTNHTNCDSNRGAGRI